MNNEELIDRVLGQIETDVNDEEFNPLYELIEQLLENEDNKQMFINYLSE